MPPGILGNEKCEMPCTPPWNEHGSESRPFDHPSFKTLEDALSQIITDAESRIPMSKCKTADSQRMYGLRRLNGNYGASPWLEVEEAYEVLQSNESRKEYDDLLGLHEKRRSRMDMRPLGFFSKSLSKAQQNWTTWERELLVVVESSLFFRSMAACCHVHVHRSFE